MKRFVSIFLCAVLFLTASSAFAEIEKAEYTFLDIPWLSSVDTVKSVISDKMTTDIPTGEFELSSWTALSYNDDSATIENVPTYKLTYSGRYYYKVADFKVRSIDIDFVPTATDGTYSDTDFSDYQMVRACYSFNDDNLYSYSDIYSSLEKKLTSLYGEPSDTFSDSSYSAYFTLKTNGLVWIGENNTIVKLHYSNSYTSITGTIEGVYINYCYTDASYIDTKTNLTVVSSESSNIDVGSTSGL